MNLSDLLKVYVKSEFNTSSYVLDDQFAIIDKPSFSILPNHPYRNPLTVVVYCTSGYGKGRVNTRIFDLQKDGFMIVLQGQITEMLDLSSDFSATYIIMTELFTNSLGISNSFSLHNVVSNSPYLKLERQSKEALESYLSMCRNLIPTENNPNRLEIVRLLTRAFFLGMGYFLHKTEQQIGVRNDAITKMFVGLVEQNYTEHRDLGFYAEKLNLTAKHLSRVVKEASGKSATEWIEKYVILDAESQLLSTHSTIKEIAYKLNFPSQSCFGKFFCRIKGVSPATYRRCHADSYK